MFSEIRISLAQRVWAIIHPQIMQAAGIDHEQIRDAVARVAQDIFGTPTALDAR
jgi:hypothetical protein